MATKPRPERKQKLTDDERHKRFVDMAREVGASDDLEALNNALRLIAKRTGTAPTPKVTPKLLDRKAD
jgi:hypothetical protein